MGGCSILGCKSRTEIKQDENVTFHSFPKDLNLRKVWIEATGRQNWQPTKSSKICSIHFNNDAIIMVNKVKRIIPEALPVNHVHAPVVSSVQTETIGVGPSTSSAAEHSRQDVNISELVTTPTRKRKYKSISPRSPRKKLCVTARSTPRKEKLLEIKLQRSKQLSTKRLLKLRAAREAKRRLIKKNDHLQTILTELQCKMTHTKTHTEDLDPLACIDSTNAVFIFAPEIDSELMM